MRKSAKITWRALVQSTIEFVGGKATRQQLFNVLKNHPKSKNNNNLNAKIRQVINLYTSEFIKHNDGHISLAS